MELFSFEIQVLSSVQLGPCQFSLGLMVTPFVFLDRQFFLSRENKAPGQNKTEREVKIKRHIFLSCDLFTSFTAGHILSVLKSENHGGKEKNQYNLLFIVGQGLFNIVPIFLVYFINKFLWCFYIMLWSFVSTLVCMSIMLISMQV